ncbi:response regulator [Fluviispira multicolorata]|uniref:Response regulator n=1 Tax=Fluviispira multicolorata TaxID=2654512 RepID=A0A833JHX0_9BACT|nr:response regulator [Fluviispira multicolorata]KAB8033687.1 response regulator [Fluviispira multicolorata]
MRKVIILMDDSPEMHLITKKALETLDIDFISCHNEKELLAAIIQNTRELALVLLDIYMPDKNGFLVIQNIKDRFARRKFKIVFFTSIKEKKYILQGMSLKADGFIIKPFEVEDFRAKILKLIE